MLLNDSPSTDGAASRALEERYGARNAPTGILWNDTIAHLLAHRSVRNYRSDPLPEEAVPTIIAAAQSASSSSNLQCWSVVAVSDPDRKKKLAELAGNQAHIIQAPLLLVWIADLARAHAIAADAEQPAEGLGYLESFLVAAVDAALAAQNAVVAAESLGLGAVYIGALRNKPEEVAEILDLPPHAAGIFGLVVGWPEETAQSSVKPRLPQPAVLHHERYSLAHRAAWQSYDEASRSFQKFQGLGTVGWIAQLLARSRNAASLHGRDRLSEALRALGFGLR
jgi:nitroreductase